MSQLSGVFSDASSSMVEVEIPKLVARPQTQDWKHLVPEHTIHISLSCTSSAAAVQDQGQGPTLGLASRQPVNPVQNVLEWQDRTLDRITGTALQRNESASSIYDFDDYLSASQQEALDEHVSSSQRQEFGYESGPSGGDAPEDTPDSTATSRSATPVQSDATDPPESRFSGEGSVAFTSGRDTVCSFVSTDLAAAYQALRNIQHRGVGPRAGNFGPRRVSNGAVVPVPPVVVVGDGRNLSHNERIMSGLPPLPSTS